MHFLYCISLSKQQSIIPPLHYMPFPHLPYYTLFAPQRFLHNLCLPFALAITVVPRETETMFMQIFFFAGGGDKGGKQGALWEMCKWQVQVL